MVLLAPGKMYRPTGVAVDPDPTTPSVYVVEQYNHRVSKWDFTPTEFVFTLDVTWGNNGDGTTGQAGPVSGPTDNNLDHPTGIVFDEDNDLLYMTDTHHNRVRTIDPADGSFLGSVGQGGRGEADFYRPAGIVNDVIHDIVFVADEFNHGVKEYDSGNPLVLRGELTQPTPLRFNRPHGIIFQTNDNFFVGDTVTNVLSRYREDPVVFQDQVGQAGISGDLDDWYFTGSGQIYNEGANDVYVPNTRSNQMKVLFGTSVSEQYTNPGTGDSQLYWPEASAKASVGGTDYNFIANTLNNRVEVFEDFDDFQTNFGSP